MTQRPRAVVVETHGVFDASTRTVQHQLELMGYNVKEHGVANPEARDHNEEREIRILSATKK